MASIRHVLEIDTRVSIDGRTEATSGRTEATSGRRERDDAGTRRAGKTSWHAEYGTSSSCLRTSKYPDASGTKQVQICQRD